MQPSIFNVRVPLTDRGEVFLMNTLTDAQVVVPDSVAALLDSLGSGAPPAAFDAETRDSLQTLADLGFVVKDRDQDRRALEDYFAEVRESRDQLRLTVLTTLQCNFACDYCFQGDHGDHNAHAHKMSLETAARVVRFAEERLDALAPAQFGVTFFGGEPLLNLPVLYFLAERLHAASTARGVRFFVNVITNGLLLTRDVVDRLKPYGLNGVKITLDGDQATHDRLRPLRGRQGTFDRIIANLRAVAGECRISIGGNFDAESAASYPALLDFLAAQEFAPAITKVAFKPVIRAPRPDAAPSTAGRRGAIIPLTPVGGDGRPLGGTCMTAAGSGSAGRQDSPCDSCGFVDEAFHFLREETKKRGFATMDGVHMGPCEIHRKHAYTVGPDGELYACPGFTGDATQATGHVDRTPSPAEARARERFDALAAWRACGDCSFIPVCAGGCSVASHAELGDMNTPTCHRASFESALVPFALDQARTV
jgi:uncharacterized protein